MIEGCIDEKEEIRSRLVRIYRSISPGGKRPRDGHTTAFVCKNHVCQFPTSNPETFAHQLQAITPLFEEGKPPPLFPPGLPFPQ